MKLIVVVLECVTHFVIASISILLMCNANVGDTCNNIINGASVVLIG